LLQAPVQIKKYFEKQLFNQSSQYEKYRKFSVMKGSHHVQPPNRQLTPFSVSKDQWNAKEGTGKTMKNALYIQYLYCGMSKSTSRAKATSNSEKSSP